MVIVVPPLSFKPPLNCPETVPEGPVTAFASVIEKIGAGLPITLPDCALKSTEAALV